MPQIIIEVTEQRKRIFDALCIKNGLTIEQMFEGHLSMVEQNEGRVYPDDSEEDRTDALERLEAKAQKTKLDRENVSTLQYEVTA